MAKDKSKLIADKEGNTFRFGKDGTLAEVMVDGKVRRVVICEEKKK
jgi:hypothetical protein